MARSRRGEKKEHCKAVKMLFMFDGEAVQVYKRRKAVSLGLREHEQTRTVVDFSFLSLPQYSFSGVSHTLFQANKKMTPR